MSLVNEMLRNLDARRAQAGPEGVRLLDGLSATPRRVMRTDRITRIAACIAAALLAGLCVLSLWDRLHSGEGSANDGPSLGSRLARLDSIERMLRESGARAAMQRDAGLPDVSTAAALRTGASADDSVELVELRVEAAKAGARLVFELSGETSVDMEHTPDGSGLRVTLGKTRTAATLPRLELADTPIQSLHMTRSGDDLRVELGFATRTRTQSALLAGEDSARLVLDLDPDGAGAAPPAAADSTAVTRRIRPPTMDQLADQSYRAALDLEGRGETQAAVAALQDALDFDPLHLAARETLIALLLRAGREAEAELLLEHGRELAPEHRGFAKAQARLLMARGELDEAADLLDAATPTAQEDPEYRALAAALYQRQGKHSAAIEEYRELLRFDSRQAVWWMGLAICFEGQGQSEKALVAYRTAAAVGGLSEDSHRYVSERIRRLERPGD